MRWLAAPLLVLGLLLAAAPASAQDPGGLRGLWATTSPLLLSVPGTTENVAGAGTGAVAYFAHWGAGLGSQGLANLFAQLPRPLCC